MPKPTDQPLNPPTLTKDMVVAHAGKNLKNGKDEFDLTVRSLDRIVANFDALGRQVPVYMGGEHFEDRADRLADGWVNKLRRDGDDLIAEVKLHGPAAAVVQGDMMRGISIGTVMGKDVHGEDLGEVLDHLLITNQPFFNDLNIAASDKQAECRVTYLTACSKEATSMADPEVVDPKDEELKKLVDEEKPDEEMEDDEEFPDEEFTLANYKKLRRLAKKLRDLQIGLTAKNETMAAQLKAKSGLASQDKEKMAVRLKRLEIERDAQSVRELVNDGLSRLTLKGAWTAGYKGEDGDGGQGTLDWLLSSRFADDSNPTDTEAAFRTLKYQVQSTDPIAKLDTHYAAGVKADSLTLSQDETDLLRRLGMTPDELKAGLKADSASHHKALTAKKVN